MSEERTSQRPEDAVSAEKDQETQKNHMDMDNRQAPETGEREADPVDEALNRARAEVAKYKEEAMRALADLENTRRRHEREMEGARRYALESFLQELLPVVDSLELGLAAVSGESPEVAKFREGTELTLKMLHSLLEKHGVTPLDPVGEKFNPELHQAMSMQESSEAEPGTVLNVVQKGYRLHDRVIRPAMVIVAKAPDQPPQGGRLDERA